MTDDQLLKNIKSIVSEEIKKETNPLAKNLKLLSKKVDSIEKRQKRHGKTLGPVKKSVEIIGRVYDERIVKIGLPSNP